MDNKLEIFNNKEFGKIRIFDDKETGKTLFSGKDIAEALGYSNTKDAIRRHVKGGVKRALPTPGGLQEMVLITEGDVYRLITHSKLPSAQKFESWVFDEVLPSIRKNGYYINRQEMRLELTEDLLSGYDELQPRKARLLNDDLIRSYKDQIKVLKAENSSLQNEIASYKGRVADLEKIIDDVKNQLLRKLLAGEEI